MRPKHPTAVLAATSLLLCPKKLDAGSKRQNRVPAKMLKLSVTEWKRCKGEMKWQSTVPQ